MLMEDVREKAKTLGIKTARRKKNDLIREIQAAEGNFPCFGTATDYCDQFECCFRGDCLNPEN
ncbi:MAG: SAP domain-containing protein [Deltaproteobacteria bacterium]|nr:SAP domain-containing protein [Deltaproteobacteria bacterium]